MQRRNPRICASDRARLLLNTPETANRFVWFNDRLSPILHLPLHKLERFRGATEPMEELMSLGFEVGFKEIIFSNRKAVNEIMKTNLVEAAAIVLNITNDEVRSSGTGPMAVLSIVLEQWVHNSEAEVIKKIFPMPPNDKDDIELEDDPSEDNPLALVEKMASGYHWPLEKSLELTLPQIYLMGNSSAWSWHKSEIKSEDGDSPRKARHTMKVPKEVDGKSFKSFKEMTSTQYKQYLQDVGLA